MVTRKAVVDETHIRKSTDVCKSILGIDAGHLHSFSICQPIPTGLYTRYNFDSDLQGFKKSRSFKNLHMSHFPRIQTRL